MLREHGATVEQVIFEEAGRNLLLVDIKRAMQWVQGRQETGRVSPVPH